MLADTRLEPPDSSDVERFDSTSNTIPHRARPFPLALVIFLFAIIVSLTNQLVAAPSVSLTWTASTSSVVGYNVYRGTQSGGPYTKLNSSLVIGTTYSDATVQVYQTYYYVATDVNSNNVESAYSNEAQVFVPCAPVTSQLAFKPSSVAFGSVPSGGKSTQSVTLSNTGTDTVCVSGDSLNATSFSTSGLVAPLTLTGGQSAAFSVAFAPSAAGSFTGTLAVVSNASNSPTNLALSGTGVTLPLGAAPSTLSFGNVSVGTTSSPQPVTLSNTGTASVTVSQANVAGAGFSISGLTLPLNLGAGQKASFNVTFAPTATGSVTGSISVVSNASNSPCSISLAGTGVTAQLAASPSSLSFGNVRVGTTSSPQTVTLTNTAMAGVTVSQANVSGSGFTISGLTLPLAMVAGQKATFNVTFAPTAKGSVTGSILVVGNAASSPTAVALSGAGVKYRVR